MTADWSQIDWREVKRLATEAEVAGTVLELVTAMRVNMDAGCAELPFVEAAAELACDPEHAAAGIFFAVSILVPLLQTLDEFGVDTARWVQRMGLKYAGGTR